MYSSTAPRGSSTVRPVGIHLPADRLGYVVG
jgi:hypothetical protein